MDKKFHRLNLYVLTDATETQWLSYILEEFARIYRARFNTLIVPINKEMTKPELGDQLRIILYYTRQPRGKISIPNASGTPPGKEILYLDEELFVFHGTITRDKRFILEYDLFWNAFIVLSRLEEYNAEKYGCSIGSYARKHPRKDKRSFVLPVVNRYFDELKRLLQKQFPTLEFGEREKAIIELSHDVDYISKTLQLKVKQTLFSLFNAFRNIGKPVTRLRHFRRMVKLLLGHESYWCFDYWEELEKSFHKRSVFYVYSRVPRLKNPVAWFLDPSYDVTADKKLICTLQHLVEEGFKIGLHGSYFSAVDGELLAEEKEKLQATLGFEVNRVRQHWLRYEEMVTPYLHERLFKIDSTIGWNDLIGFRAGCASAYRPYDHKNQRAFDFFEVPQVVMDSTLYDYLSKEVYLPVGRGDTDTGGTSEVDKAGIVSCIRLIQSLERFQSVHIAVSWHQRVCSDDYGWNKGYIELLRKI